jgi:Protein of unknown function (DUF1524)
MSLQGRALFGVLTMAVAAAVAACTPRDSGQPGDSQPSPAAVAQARRELAGLVVAPPRGGGYQRVADFGAAWVYDTDHNGCRTRDDVLRRDLAGVRTSGRCTVVAGTLNDPYTGVSVRFSRSDAAAVQVDHVYPLGLAWQHGAAGWPQQRRLAFANDSANLLATTAHANESKGDRGPARWLPPSRGYRCAYAVRYVAVATRYGLSVSAADRAALSASVDTCRPGRSGGAR